MASMVGFVAGLPFLYQMVSRERQLEVPKYVRPRTDTPALTVGHGGCFGCIYSVRGAGGYQMFGITPVPIYDPGQELPDFEEFVCFFEPGDIVKFEPIDRERYDELRAEASRRADLHPPAAGDVRPRGVHRRPRRLQRAAAGGAPCRLRSTKPGLSTTVQDRGREGYYHVGVPPSGALDQFSLVAANLLVGNPADAAALECAYMGPELRFTEPTRRGGRPARSSSRGSTARRSRAGRRSRWRPATCSRSAT